VLTSKDIWRACGCGPGPFQVLSKAEMEREIAADMRLRGLDPASPENRAAFEAEVDEIMTAALQRAGLDRTNINDCEEIVRLMETGVFSRLGEHRALH
jgi:hypothetical protein